MWEAGSRQTWSATRSPWDCGHPIARGREGGSNRVGFVKVRVQIGIGRQREAGGLRVRRGRAGGCRRALEGRVWEMREVRAAIDGQGRKGAVSIVEHFLEKCPLTTRTWARRHRSMESDFQRPTSLMASLSTPAQSRAMAPPGRTERALMSSGGMPVCF